MSQLIDNAQIEEATQTLDFLREQFTKQYLKKHCRTVEEQLDGYEGCCKYKTVWSEGDYQEAREEAREEADKVLSQAFKKLNINFINN